MFAQYPRQEEIAMNYNYHGYSDPYPPAQQHFGHGLNESIPMAMDEPMEEFNTTQEDHGTARKEADEGDTSSRPRLTTEQTNVLEEHFRLESKPVTDIKRRLADQVGLSLEKVNVSHECCRNSWIFD